MGRLDIRICEARNLPDVQTLGKPDPYCIVRCENQQHKTRVIDDNLNPKWEEVFKFQIADENSAQLRLELWNKNLVSDELLGIYSLSISSLKKGLVSDKWYLLQNCKGNAELRIRMCALDFGPDPTPEEKAQVAQLGGQPAPAIPFAGPAFGVAYVAPVIAPAPQYPPQPVYAPPQQPYPPAAPYGAPQQPAYGFQQPQYGQQPAYGVPPQQQAYGSPQYGSSGPGVNAL